MCLALAQCSPSSHAVESPPPPVERIAADFEPQSDIVVAAAQMVQFHPKALVEIVGALEGHVRVLLLVGRERERNAVQLLLHENGISPNIAEYISLPLDSMWARDYGPVFCETADGVCVIDTEYAEYEGRGRDDGVPALLAKWLGVPLRGIPLSLEGGNVLTNGKGLVLSTTRVLEINMLERGLESSEIERIFEDDFAAERWAYLPPLQGEATGHVDIFCAFTAPDQVVVARMDPTESPVNAARLDESARLLEQLEVDGSPMLVHRVDMPAAQDGIFRTYTNVMVANDVVLVPIYPDSSPDLDARALALYAQLFPRREIVGIDASSLVRRRGALRCVSFQVPSYIQVR